jgi:protein SCO1/2
MKNKTLLKLFITLLLVVFFITGCSPSFKGAVVNPTTPAADFNMTDQNGKPFQLSAQRGKIVMVFFGFLNCPDECPVTMAKLSQAVSSLGDQAKNVQVVLVSTDPVRDTPQGMQAYLANFNSSFVGITGSMDDLKKIWNDYGVMVLDGGETHSSYTYVVDQKGDLRLTFDTEMSPDDIASDLSKLLSAQ